MTVVDEPDSELDIDVRSVSVIWQDDDTVFVDLSGCASAFEAIGLLRVALRSLEDDCAFQEEEEDS